MVIKSTIMAFAVSAMMFMLGGSVSAASVNTAATASKPFVDGAGSGYIFVRPGGKGGGGGFSRGGGGGFGRGGAKFGPWGGFRPRGGFGGFSGRRYYGGGGIGPRRYSNYYGGRRWRGRRYYYGAAPFLGYGAYSYYDGDYDGYYGYGGGSCYANCRLYRGPAYCRTYASDYC